MKKYFKNGKQVQKPSQIIVKGNYIIHPSDERLIKAGYEIVDNTVEEDNSLIKAQRQAAYKATADQYLIAYQAYTELGEHEKAAEMKELWIQERNRIDKEYPYITE